MQIVGSGGDNWIAGNWMGVDATGATALANNLAILLMGTTQNNVIGTNGDGLSDDLEGNVLSGNWSGAVALDVEPTNNWIAGNYIGTDVTGTLAVPNGGGIDVDGDYNVIGTNGDGVSDELERNVISGAVGDGKGISIDGASYNWIAGNYIGTDVTGTIAIPNEDVGIEVDYDAAFNVIGTNGDGVSDDLEGNLIAGSSDGSYGMILQRDNHDNWVAGNVIGTDVTGLVPMPHDVAMLIDSESQDNLIGTNGDGVSDALEGNTIAKNFGTGVAIRYSGAKGNAIRGNAIYDNGDLGIDLYFDWITPNDPDDADSGPNTLQNFPVLTAASSEGADTLVEGALDSTASTTFDLDFYASGSCHYSGFGEGEVYLGTDQVTTDANGDVAFSISLPTGTQSGEAVTGTATDPNGNTSEFSPCVEIDAGPVPGLFVVNSVGDGPDSNPGDGVCDDGAGNCTLRAAIEEAESFAGTDTIAFDIPGSGPHTIQPASAYPVITEPVVIDGTTEPDYVGVPIIELDGSSAGAGANGLDVTAGSSTLRGLVINRFDGHGVRLGTNGGNTLEWNAIGTDVTGMLDLGNGGHGVYVDNAPDNVIGGTIADAWNIISGNAEDGVVIYGADATGNVVLGNLIGTDVTGSAALGNGGHGILIEEASGNLVGGTTPGAGNLIAGNVEDGLYVDPASGGASGNSLRGNSLFSNGGLGIDLAPDGVTANDTGDADAGANNLQNFPLLTAATSDGTSTTTVDGTLDSTADTIFDLDFYASAACDASGNGEGALYLGSDQVTTDANGDVAFSSVLAVVVADGQFVTAAASGPDGSTSELSGCAEVGAQTVEDQVYDWHYDYDPLGRVTDACSDWDEVGQTCLGDAFSFEYDGAGNVTTFSRWDEAGGQVETVRYVYNGANQIACLDGDANQLCGDPGDTDYVYDAYGNLTDDGANTYVYDAANRLVSVSDGVSTSTYTYNGDGDRVGQTVDGVETTYLLDVATPLTMVLSETIGSETIHYFHALGLVAESDGTDTDYFAADGLGSVRQLTDGSADVLLAQTFDPYGNPYASGGAGGSAFGFTGEMSDASGLLYLRARYYNPALGRFFQRDTWTGQFDQPQTLNPYTYGLGNPVLHTDPSGHCILGLGCAGTDSSGNSAANTSTRNTYNLSLTVFSDCGNPFAGDFVAGFLDQFILDMTWNGDLVNITYDFVDATLLSHPNVVTAIGRSVTQMGRLDVDALNRSYATGSPEYRLGREAGRVASTIVSTAEAIAGITALVGSISLTIPTGGLTGLCIGITAGVGTLGCGAVGGAAISVELAAAAVGTAATVHGGGVLFSNQTNPVGGEGFVLRRSNTTGDPIAPPSRGQRGELRRNLNKTVPRPSDMVNVQAHHDLPWNYKDWFAERGLYVNDIEFGRWVEGSPPGPHQSWSPRYTAVWGDWIEANPNASQREVLEFLAELRASGAFPAR